MTSQFIQMIYSFILFWVNLLVVEKSYDCSSISETIRNDVDKNDRYETLARLTKTQTVRTFVLYTHKQHKSELTSSTAWLTKFNIQ